jgi:CobQ-like glutamine amidotransferase family enzyme
VLATYLHGPVLAQNPALADLLLGWAIHDLPPLEDSPEIANLRKVRRNYLGV